MLITFNSYDAAVSNAYNATGAHHFSADYVYGTNWYAFGMMRLPVMDFFDMWFKIDWDVKFFGPMPDLLEVAQYESKQPAVAVFSDYYDEPDWVTLGTLDWERAVFAEASQGCPGVRAPFTCRDAATCHSRRVVHSNFIGGYMGFWQSPEVMWLASRYEVFLDGMWQHRWGDQQFWSHVMAMLLSAEEQRELVVNVWQGGTPQYVAQR